MTRTPLPPLDHEAAGALWSAYVHEHPEHAQEVPPVEVFGDSVEMADELLDLVLHGPKRATASLVADYGTADLPAQGSHWVVCDGRGDPRVVLRSTDTRVGRLDSVDDAFAHDEGEGDRTRAWWVDAHLAYCARADAAAGREHLAGATPMLFERFAVVWPPEHAGRG